MPASEANTPTPTSPASARASELSFLIPSLPLTVRKRSWLFWPMRRGTGREGMCSSRSYSRKFCPLRGSIGWPDALSGRCFTRHLDLRSLFLILDFFWSAHLLVLSSILPSRRDRHFRGGLN